MKPQQHLSRLMILGTAISALSVACAFAQQSSGGYIFGNADPGAQIVVTNDDTGSVSGFVAHADGTYKTQTLPAGPYSIRENGGGHHATRHLSVKDGETSNVDLAPAHN